MKILTIAAIVLCAVSMCASVALSAASAPTIRMPHIFGDNMVLQSGPATPVWGWAKPGDKVTVSLGPQKQTATVGKDGKWTVTLKNLAESDVPTTMTVSYKASSVTIKNILIADVWVGSGQSNMDFWTAGATNAAEEMAKANYPKIRIFKVAMKFSGQPRDDVDGQWQECNPQTIVGFSAVLYFFGRDIYLKTGRPLGLLQTCVGGTNIERWMSPESFNTSPILADFAKNIAAKDADYRAMMSAKMDTIDFWLKNTREAIAQGKPIPAAPIPDHPQDNATTLFNGMVYPIIPFGIKGAIWYQGESNGNENESYLVKTQALVGGWRKLWGRGDFPFYWVQLANYLQPNDNPGGDTGWGGCRDAQRRALAIPNTGMASAIDLADAGNPDDIHPKNKQDVGGRLALWALRDVYGFKDIVPSGPLYKSIKIEDNKVRISFDCVGKGLMIGEKVGLEPTKEIKDGKLKRFAIAGEDKVWHWADAVIDGDTVVLSSPDVPKPVAVRYAYSMNPAGANLYNKEGLPASPFTTADW